MVWSWLRWSVRVDQIFILVMQACGTNVVPRCFIRLLTMTSVTTIEDCDNIRLPRKTRLARWGRDLLCSAAAAAAAAAAAVSPVVRRPAVLHTYSGSVWGGLCQTTPHTDTEPCLPPSLGRERCWPLPGHARPVTERERRSLSATDPRARPQILPQRH